MHWWGVYCQYFVENCMCYNKNLLSEYGLAQFTLAYLQAWTVNSQRTPHSSPVMSSYGVSSVSTFQKTAHVFTGLHCVLHSLWPIETIRQYRSGSALAQVMVCCHSSEGNFTKKTPQPPITEICLKFHSNLPAANQLNHWGRVTQICISKLTIIVSDNGLSPGRRLVIIWTNDGILLIRPLAANFNEFLIEIHTFSFKKIHFKMSSGKRSQCIECAHYPAYPCPTMPFSLYYAAAQLQAW